MTITITTSNQKVTSPKTQRVRRMRWIRFIFKYPGALFPSFAAKVALKLFMTPGRKPVSLPYIFEKAHVLSIPYQNGKVRTYMWGYTGSIVLLVHGWESGPHAYEHFIEPLVNAGYRVVAMEGPAHGDSLQRQTNMIDFGNALHAVMTRLERSGGVSAMIGHSFGGATLVQMLTRFPIPSTLEKIILIASPARIDHVFARYFDMIQLSKSAQRHFRVLLKFIFHLEMEKMQLKYWLEGIPHLKALLIHDRQDKVIPFIESETLVAHWPLATLMETADQGHYRIMKSSNVIERIKEFLS